MLGDNARRQWHCQGRLARSRMALKPFKTRSRPRYILGDCAKWLCHCQGRPRHLEPFKLRFSPFSSYLSHFSSVSLDSSYVLLDFSSFTRLHQWIPSIWRLKIFGIGNLFIFFTSNLQIIVFGRFLTILGFRLKIVVDKICLSFVESICAIW